NLFLERHIQVSGLEFRIYQPFPGFRAYFLLSQDQAPVDRLDILNFETQLLRTLCSVPSLAEKNNSQLVTLLFNAASSMLEGTGYEFLRPTMANTTFSTISSKAKRQRLSSYLELFATFSNPKALYRSQDLYNLFLKILANGESRMQKLAFDCLLTWKSPF